MRFWRMGRRGADFASEREAMVERQLRARGITRSDLLDAFRSVPREAFVGQNVAHLAYGDHPLPIEGGQTISQPYIVGLMIEAVGLKAGDKALEVGSGSGYAAAVMSRIAAVVIGIERRAELVMLARERMRSLGYDNVTILKGDGTLGVAREAPFDAILVAASGSHVPQHLTDQLAPGGRLVIPIGEPGSVQKLIQIRKNEDGSLRRSDLGRVRFVPLIGEEGWIDAQD
ncbi:MAG TPA: protein-L-isoaspartate(D-aspartate) O-methyltransferase [Sphingomicrobium sp.]|nr:protein-L-isoaspartate(D-aspartate) O-methyltransferase [Sphingomicrobium sp.]